MATTTNYSWTTPDDTDLVKDGAAAIRTLGSSADTTVKDLNPGTTAGDIDYYTSSTAKARIAIGTANQVLQVNSGATAPEWGVDPVADVITTAGDILYGTAADTVARLGIGTAGQVLTVNSGATAPEWATASGGGFTYTSYSPTFTNLTVGNGSWAYAVYAQSGNMVHYIGKFDLGSTSSVSGNITISLPVTASSNMSGVYVNTIQADDNGVGDYPMLARMLTTGFQTFAINAAGTYAHSYTPTGATVPITWSSGDQINFSIVYEAA